METKIITFITGNSNKLSEIQSIINFPIQADSVDLPELQGSPVEIAVEKCRQAALIVNNPVFVEDTCLIFNAFKSLPGPYIKHFLKELGPKGLFKMLEGFEDKSAKAMCTIAYTDGVGSEVHLFQGITEGCIVEPLGDGGFGWDGIFAPSMDKDEVQGRSYAQMTKVEKNAISHRYKAVQKFQNFMNEKEERERT